MRFLAEKKDKDIRDELHLILLRCTLIKNKLVYLQAVRAADKLTTAHVVSYEHEQDTVQRRDSSPFRDLGSSEGKADPWIVTGGDGDPWRQSGAPVEFIVIKKGNSVSANQF